MRPREVSTAEACRRAVLWNLSAAMPFGFGVLGIRWFPRIVPGYPCCMRSGARGPVAETP